MNTSLKQMARCRGLAVLVAAAALGAGAAPVAAQGSAGDNRIVVSLDQKQLWYLNHRGDTLFNAPIAVGKSGTWELFGKQYTFSTPRGTRRVLGKREDPSWTPPDWHYFEKAIYKGLEPVHLPMDTTIVLADSSIIEVRDGEVGRRAYVFDGERWRTTDWHRVTPGLEIIFDGKMFIPPLGSPQRKIPDALGPYKLDLGEGYLIHGTHEYNKDSIGGAASHGCIRMRNDDVTRLYSMVPVGTVVEIR